MKKIISFSLWGTNPGYVEGGMRNILAARKHYPGWTCRFYVDDTLPSESRDALLSEGAEVKLMPRGTEFLGLFWRFHPMFDDGQIERFIVRDTDSVVNAREAAAVKEWKNSYFPFHIMRDNPQHNIPIMGGMWGSKPNIIPGFAKEMERYIATVKPDPKNPRGMYHNADQLFLASHVWPYIEACHLAHDEHYKPTVRERPFSVKLKRDGYVGMVYTDMDADRIEAEV